MTIPVDLDQFDRAETDRMFASLQAQAGGVNRWQHGREPTPIDQQPVIRMNRDTLYSMAIVDISGGAMVTLPDAGDRYLSVMVVDQDHYVDRVLHDAGTYQLTIDEFATPYVCLAARILVDPSDAADLAVVHRLQDGLGLEAASSRPFAAPDWDQASLDAVRAGLQAEARNGLQSDRMFGARHEVDAHRHRIGTAVGWGGLPSSEASYVGGPAGLPTGAYRMVFRDVPVDGFWSISVYGGDGYFVPNALGRYNVNSVTATKEADGSVVVHLGGCDDGRTNCLPIPEGWNTLIRLYRPRAAALDGSYQVPVAEPLD